MRLKGNITISKVTQSKGPGYISITISDENSHCTIVNVEVPFEQFALAITGLGHQPCALEYYEGAPIGKVRECKTELIEAPGYVPVLEREAIGRSILAPYEVDGWKGYVDDLFNSNKSVRTKNPDDPIKRRVGFSRYISKDCE